INNINLSVALRIDLVFFNRFDPLKMNLNTATVSLIPLLLSLAIPFFLFIWRFKLVTSTGKTPPPLAAGAWPLTGHLPLLSRVKLPHITLGAMADKHGPLFTLKLGIKTTVVVSNWKIAKECFTINDHAVTSRPQTVASKVMGYNAMFAFVPYGLYWRDLRKIATLELLSNRRIQLLSHVRVSEIGTSITELYKNWDKKKNGSSSHFQVELKQWFGELTLNVVLRMICGKRCFGMKSVEEENEGRRCLSAIREFMHLMGQFVPSDAIPGIGWLDLGGYKKAMMKTARELDCLLSKWLEEHRGKRASGHEMAKEDRDFMDVMLSVLDDAKLLHGFDADTIIKATSVTMILGGIDTTTVTLLWSMSLLLNNLNVLKKAQEELDVHVGKDRFVKESDLDKLVYIQAITKETLRLHPAAPLSATRELIEDCTIAGFHISKGTRLITNIWKIQTDPSIWTDPLEFKPERFLTTHRNVELRGNHYEFIPFGSGRRMCPGMSFALQWIHFTLATFLHSFEISTPKGEQVDMTETFGLTNMKTTPLHVLVKPRLPSKLSKSCEL
ncbi:Cytochrome P450 family protein, partial [Quillaja saponaria]